MKVTFLGAIFIKDEAENPRPLCERTTSDSHYWLSAWFPVRVLSGQHTATQGWCFASLSLVMRDPMMVLNPMTCE